MENKQQNAVDNLAERIYDYCCSHRKDNLNKDGSPSDPRKVGSEFEKLFEDSKHHYRNCAKFFLDLLKEMPQDSEVKSSPKTPDVLVFES